MMEQWIPVAEHDGYEVSDQGNVRSWVKMGRWGGRATDPRILAPRMCGVNRRYQQVNLGRAVQVYISDLVLEAFVGPRPVGMEACYNDGDTNNNALANLRWDTKKANTEQWMARAKA